jgi:hypothetical protein
MTIQDAKDTTVYLIETEGKRIPHSFTAPSGKEIKLQDRFEPTHWRIRPVNFHEFVCGFAEQGTNPDGAGPKLHISRNEDYREVDGKWEDCSTYELRLWDPGGRRRLLETFDTEEEADEEWFRRTYEYDFSEANDNTFYSTEDEAKEAIIETIGDTFGVDKSVSNSLFSKMQLIDSIKAERDAKAEQTRNAENERVDKLANIYAAMIEPIAGEKDTDTAKRLGEAIHHQRIEKKVFWQAIRLVRKKARVSALASKIESKSQL